MVGPARSSTSEIPAPSDRVLDAIAEAEGTSPMEFDQRLYDAIDPDALDALFESASVDIQIEFTYMDYDITITRDGGIQLDHPDG